MKKLVQTVSYLPHFVSFVVVANIALTFLSPSGQVNGLLSALGIVKGARDVFHSSQGASGGWWRPSTFGRKWAGRPLSISAPFLGSIPSFMKQPWWTAQGGSSGFCHHVARNCPHYSGAADYGGAGPLLNAGFDASYLLGNAMVSDYSEVLDTYVYRLGIQQGQYSYATAIGCVRQYRWC